MKVYTVLHRSRQTTVYSPDFSNFGAPFSNNTPDEFVRNSHFVRLLVGLRSALLLSAQSGKS